MKTASVPCRSPAKGRAPFRITTIRSQILFAFLAVSLVSISLGLLAVGDLRRDGALVDQTFDRSLMSINYARAASADFNALQAAFARSLVSDDPMSRAKLEKHIVVLEGEMVDDLAIAVERAQSARVRIAAQRVSQAVEAWKLARDALAGGAEINAVWRALDRQASVVAQQIDLLINYTAGDGFTIRQAAHRSIQNDTRVVITAICVSIAVAGVIALLLSLRILALVRHAADVARQIADGKLDTIVEVRGNDELGAMLASMDAMRLSIKTSMEHEVAMRESAQMRLADSLESSSEGVVVVDARSTIALANSQAMILLRSMGDSVAVGAPATPLLRAVAALPGETSAAGTSRDLKLPNDRWLRVSQNATSDGGSIVVCSDITILKDQEAALKASNLWLDVALSNLSQGLCLFDAELRLKVFNQRFCEILELPPATVSQGMRLADVAAMAFVDDDNGAARRNFESGAAMHVKRHQMGDELITLASGRKVSISHRPLADDSWLATLEDVTDRLLAETKIAFMARHDALTGLPNRVLFAERAEIALAAVGRGEGFALLCLDLDHFKQVNDTLGHPIRDDLLRIVAACLKACLRETDMVARLGGDEFAIIQTNIGSPEEATVLARRIVEVLNAPVEIEGHRIAIGVSIGISIAPSDGSSYGKLFKNADVALYKAKADGRNTWRFFESEMDERLQARRLLEIDLREALECGHFDVHYQPLYEIGQDRVMGAEALIRWTHPTRGAVAPSDFIPLAEEIGLITRIGDWVLERACRDAAGWSHGACVAVNVSAAQVRDGGLVRKVVEVLFATGLPASRLDLEITESVLLANTNSTLLMLNQLREIGVRISMDDFGTGYSSLSYLRSFPFDKVKIDRGFTRDVTVDAEARAIVRTILSLCRDLGMRTTAEGVETAEQLAFLRAEGCDQAQGFFFSRAVPSGAMMAFIEHGCPAAAPLALLSA